MVDDHIADCWVPAHLSRVVTTVIAGSLHTERRG